jgi:hypothetical protein
MPLLATALLFPPHLHELRAGDIDQDGRDELVLVSRLPRGAQPDAVQLTVVHFDAAGREEDRETLTLGQEALLWDIEAGLWAVDGDGARSLDGTRVGSQRTPLGGLGRTTPAPANIADDFDQDGVPEVFVFSGGRLHALGTDGVHRGSVPAPGSGSLESHHRAGATQLVASHRLPPFVIADADGDGRKDVLFPRKNKVVVHFSGDTLGARSATWALPLDLQPRDDPRKRQQEERRELDDAWFRDLDNDGKVDLLVHQWVVGKSWFGATAELLFARGTGSGFAPAQRIETETAAVEVRLLDYEGDGDTDLLVPLVDIGLTNLGRALVTRKVQVELGLFELDQGTFTARPRVVHSFGWPITDPDSVQISIDGDIDGDGIVDHIQGVEGAAVEVRLGTSAGISSSAAARRELTVPPGGDPFFVRDLTGDGRAEIVVWGRGEAQGTVLRLTP